MQISKTIGFRFVLGFGLLIIAITINTVLSYRTLARIRYAQQELNMVLDPSIRLLGELGNTLHQSKDFVGTWEYAGRDRQSPVVSQIASILHERIPEINQQMLGFSINWKLRYSDSYDDLYTFLMDTLAAEACSANAAFC